MSISFFRVRIRITHEGPPRKHRRITSQATSETICEQIYQQHHRAQLDPPWSRHPPPPEPTAFPSGDDPNPTTSRYWDNSSPYGFFKNEHQVH
ncbi:hypothetical protein E4U42_001844, partial [Claviceps africana]